ncbi:MAG: hypothetical protein IJ493_13285 [Clostridia bacterium]|nr:hypothetical protein [Clostridia bacterium]
MNYLLLALSMTATVVQSTLFNHTSKRTLTTQRRVYAFNVIMYAAGFVLFLLTALGGSVSGWTLGFGLLFGGVTVVQSVCNLMALARGPMHITLLITCSSMVIPSLSGVFLSGEELSVIKPLLILLLIGCIYLSIDRRDSTGFKPGWAVFTGIAFLCQAAVGVMQKVQQSSAYAGETSAFLASAFLCSLGFAAVMALISKPAPASLESGGKPGWQMTVPALICGVCVFLQNDLNLKLSGRLPSQVFFPLVNGGSLFLCTLAAVVLFREKLTRRQCVGLAGGILVLAGICLVP